MISVQSHDLKEGKFYIGYFNGKVVSDRTRKLLFVFVMGKYSDSVLAKYSISITHDKESYYNEYNEHSSRHINVESRIMALGKNVEFFELTQEEFLMLTLAETV